MFAESAYARRRRWKPGHFSFNTREGQCPTCRGLGHIDLDVQYLPDITVQCPTCHGARFNDATLAVRVDGLTIADVLGLSVHDALERFADRAPVAAALRPVSEVGLGYLRLGEPTPSLSGGESQRLRIASRLRSSQRGALYVFDEPSTGLHPLDVATLVGVFDRLLEAGATIIVIDHDLDLLAAADHLIDMGPGRRPGRRAHRRRRDAGGRRACPGQRDRAVAGRAPGPGGASRDGRGWRDVTASADAPAVAFSSGPGRWVLAITLATSGSSYLVHVLPALVVLGLGLAITTAPLTATAMNSPRPRGSRGSHRRSQRYRQVRRPAGGRRPAGAGGHHRHGLPAARTHSPPDSAPRR